MSPFEVVHGYTPRRPLDLLPMSSHDRVSVSAIEFASHMHELHKEINKRIQASNLKYKPQVDLHRRDLDFDVGDYVMIRIKPKRYPSRTVKKLQARSAGPFKVLKKLGPNAYVIDIPSDYGISSTFNIADLIAFKGPAIIAYEPLMIHPLLLWLTLSLVLRHLVSKRHIKILLMLFWMSSLFSQGMEQFSASWFTGEDGLILIVHGSPKRSCSSLIPFFWRLTWIHLLPPHLYLLSPAHMSINGGAMLT